MSYRRPLSFLAAAAICTGCFEDTGKSDSGTSVGSTAATSMGSSGGSGTDSGEFAGPASGTWLFAEQPLQNDTCMPDNPSAGAGQLEVVNHDDGTFTIIASGDAPPFACAHTGLEFTCDPIDRMDPVPLLDATVASNLQTVGAFSSAEKGSGRYIVSLSCTGTACVTAATWAGVTAFPCGYDIPFTSIYNP